MAASSDQLEQQIDDVRGSMESKIVELRTRSRAQLRRVSRMAIYAVAVGAAIGVAAVGILVVYRVTRPQTLGERFQRVLPPGLGSNVKHARRSLELGLRKQVPNLRLYVGDRQVGEEPRASMVQRIVMKAAQAAGTAAAAATVSRLMAGVRGGRGR